MRWWRDHSLTIIMAVIGTALLIFAFTHEEGKWFDLWLALGAGVLTVGLFYLLSQFFREKTKPED